MLGGGLFFLIRKMRVNSFFLAVALMLATPAIAQPAGQIDNAQCEAEMAAIERDMDVARSKGQMLRRRQLAETLSALQARCDTLTPEQRRTADIEKLEQEIQDLREALDDAQEQLRRLKERGA
jgi:septal ring factor EnvC (AmiA/AmiB activator)